MKFRIENLIKLGQQRIVEALLLILFFLFIVVFLWQHIVISIFPGQAGVRWKRFSGGTQTNYIYPEGIHLIYPWDKMYVYTLRIQQTAHEFDVLTINGLTLHLAISIRYYPERELLGVLHQKVGPEYVNTVVIPEIESVLRVLIGQLRAEEVYTTKHSIIEKAVNSAVEQIAQRYINVDNVIIKRIVFPDAISKAIEDKMSQQQLFEAYEFKLAREEREAERKRIEATGIRDYNHTIAQSLSPSMLQWKWMQSLEQSPNTKLIVSSSQGYGLPIVGNLSLDNVSPASPTPNATPAAESSESAAPTPAAGAPVENAAISPTPTPAVK